MQVQKNLPRKKRRKLEAAREMLEDNEEEEEEEEEGENKKRGRSRVSISVIHIVLDKIIKHCIDYERICLSGERQEEEERRSREERIDTSGSWLQASKGCKSKTESN